ncbi:hypothetical protein [Desulfopila inferna]|uniref:hypothetical protein n=1 Tax=Desulfopila inferna TaxID=468528 RepID=UPI00307E479E
MQGTTSIGNIVISACHRKIHDFCERRAHFDEGRFVEQYGDNGHKLGYCLYKVGCKGPATYNNCPAVRWNNVGTWPVGIGHGCVGCSEPDFWDNMSPFYERLPGIQLPLAGKGTVTGATEAGFKVLGITAAAIGIHAAVGIGKKLISSKKDSDEE